MLAFLTKWLRVDERVSPEWMRHHERQSASRVEFVGPSWAWPVNKIKNESAKWNQKRLRRSA
jgi:hypothetical protein